MRRRLSIALAALLWGAPEAARAATPGVSSDSAGARVRRAAHRPTRPIPKRAVPGDRVTVVITYYCLQGTTRTDTEAREGIVAADPRVFPLHRHVDLFARGRPLGRFLVADTGTDIVGGRIDVWTPSCAEARRRGRHRGTAVLLTRAESRAERAKQRKLDAERKRDEQRLASGK